MRAQNFFCKSTVFSQRGRERKIEDVRNRWCHKFINFESEFSMNFHREMIYSIWLRLKPYLLHDSSSKKKQNRDNFLAWCCLPFTTIPTNIIQSLMIRHCGTVVRAPANKRSFTDFNVISHLNTSKRMDTCMHGNLRVVFFSIQIGIYR